MNQPKISKWLENTNPAIFSIFAIIAAFCTYSCMYAFRKPFAVATYDGLSLWGLDYKIILIIAQVLGYMVSKFAGIKIISEMKPNKRIFLILSFIGLSELSLLFFGIVPFPYNFIFMFFNGLPLGLIWGIVFSFLEGRRITEILAAGLCISFIVASGVVKSVGQFVMNQWSVDQFYMPSVVGLIFTIPLIISVWMLGVLPPPSEEDIKYRTQRTPMSKTERNVFFNMFAFGIVMLVINYIFLTAFRDFRDNFAAELWNLLGFGKDATVFTSAEIPIALFVLIMLGATYKIKDNALAFWMNHLIIFVGFATIGITTLLFQLQIISPFLWMIFTGLGIYMGYTPYNSLLFERLIATYKIKSNAGFLIYIADAFGYLGSMLVLFYKNFFASQINWVEFFMKANYIISVLGMTFLIFSLLYFFKKYKKM